MDFTEVYKHSGSISFSPGAHLILTAIQDRLVLRRADTFQIMQTWLLDASPSSTQALTSGKLKPGLSENWVSHIGWSRDSEYVLAACAKRGVVHVYKVQDENWTARIDSGAEGTYALPSLFNGPLILTSRPCQGGMGPRWQNSALLLAVGSEWHPMSMSHALDFTTQLRVTVWSLVTGTATYIQFPVHPDTGKTFISSAHISYSQLCRRPGYAFRADGRYFVLAERHKSKDTAGVYDTADSYKLVRVNGYIWY
jgi:hypothetical protein